MAGQDCPLKKRAHHVTRSKSRLAVKRGESDARSSEEMREDQFGMGAHHECACVFCSSNPIVHEKWDSLRSFATQQPPRTFHHAHVNPIAYVDFVISSEGQP